MKIDWVHASEVIPVYDVPERHFSEAVGKYASPHRLIRIFRAHDDPRRRPDAARSDKTSALFCAI